MAMAENVVAKGGDIRRRTLSSSADHLQRHSRAMLSNLGLGRVLQGIDAGKGEDYCLSRHLKWPIQLDQLGMIVYIELLDIVAV